MNCIRTDEAGEVRLRIEGALDALTVPELRTVFDSVAADRPRRVVLDFEALALIDSSGIGAVVSLYKRIKANGGSMAIVNAHDQPQTVLGLLKLDRVFSL